MPIDLSNATQVGTATVPGIKYRDKTATYERRLFNWTGPASYPTGGEVINTLSTFGLGTVPIVLANPARNATVILIPRWDRANKKMQWFDLAGNEVANGTDLSAYSFQGEALGW